MFHNYSDQISTPHNGVGLEQWRGATGEMVEFGVEEIWCKGSVEWSFETSGTRHGLILVATVAFAVFKHFKNCQELDQTAYLVYDLYVPASLKQGVETVVPVCNFASYFGI